MTFKKVGPYLWLFPAILAMLVVVLYPLLFSTLTSFTSRNLTDPSSTKIVYLANYSRALTDPQFWSSMAATLIFVVGAVVVEFLLGLGIALLLDQGLKGAGLVEALIVVPIMAAPVVVGLMWRYMYFDEYGIIPYLLKGIGISTGDGLLVNRLTVWPALIAADTWEWTGFIALVVLAGLRSLPAEPIEAARIDGASPLQSTLYVLIPMLRPVIWTVVLIRAIDAFKVFDLIYVLTKGGPGNRTEVASYYAYKQGLRFMEIGYSAAITFIMLMLVGFACQIFLKVSYRGDKI